MKTVFIRSAYNYDADVVSSETGLAIDLEEGVTQQSFKDECDINEIVRRFGLSGEIPGDFRAPVSGDFSGVSDFHTAMNAVRDAQERFMMMPAELRARFNHDPGRLMAFLDDRGNYDEAVKLGLVQLPPEKTRDAVTAIDDLAKVLTPKPV